MEQIEALRTELADRDARIALALQQLAEKDATINKQAARLAPLEQGLAIMTGEAQPAREAPAKGSKKRARSSDSVTNAETAALHNSGKRPPAHFVPRVSDFDELSKLALLMEVQNCV
jgi:hypothetical protein